MSEEYTLEKTIAFFSMGEDHFVDKNLARHVAKELTDMSAEIERLEGALAKIANMTTAMNANAIKMQSEAMRALK